jgi:hypothetical protein
MRHRLLAPSFGVLLLALALVDCGQSSLVVTFFSQNALLVGFAWDNAISLQPTSDNGNSDTVSILLHGGRSDSDPNDPNGPGPPSFLALNGVTRLRAALLYRPDIIEFVKSSSGNFFEQNASGATVQYNISAEMGPSGPTGRLIIDLSIPSSSSTVRRGDFVKLEFRGLLVNMTSRLDFEGGFGALERNGTLITGASYYGGSFSVVASSTQ